MAEAKKEKAEKKKLLTQEDIMNMLDACYEKTVSGIQKVSPPVSQMADDYLNKYKDENTAAKTMINYQIAKCTTSGFITGFGGLITLPVAIPANIGSVLYVQMRMIACTAYMAGYDLGSDQVQTLVYACLAGVSVNAIVKQAGIKFGTKIAKSTIEKIPGKTLTKINQKVGFRFITKFGEKGIVNLGKMLPVVGAVIGGGMDLAETKIIGTRAYRMFMEGDFSVADKNYTEDEEKDIIGDDVIDVEPITED